MFEHVIQKVTQPEEEDYSVPECVLKWNLHMNWVMVARMDDIND